MKQREAHSPVVSRETHDRLSLLAGLLRDWNDTINLVADADPQLVWTRHFADSLQLIPLMPYPGPSRAIDLGSGAGFPGLVLAIATGTHFDLIEADRRKAAFLREAARRTKAPVAVHATRVERAPVEPAELVTARALAPLTTLLEYAEKLLSREGVALLPKGRSVDQEIADASRGWRFTLERHPSLTAGSTILRVSDIRRG